MDLLLDTHIFLWYLNGDERLSKKFFNAIRDINNNVYVSPVSIWECIIKQEIGKFHLTEKAGEFLSKERERHKFLTLPLTEEDIQGLHNLPSIHKDPFDRLLICQSLANNLILITDDTLIKKYKLKTI